GNADGNSEIFLYDRVTRTTRQITATAAGMNGDPSISADGNRVAYVSNVTGNSEIYLFDAPSGLTTSITNSSQENHRHPSINADGTRIAYMVVRGLAREIYLYDTVSGVTTQVTFAGAAIAGNSIEPTIADDGMRLAFSANRQIFLAECAIADLSLSQSA